MVKVLKKRLESLVANWRSNEAAIDDLQVVVAVTIGIMAFLTFLSVGCSGMKSTPPQASTPESDSRAAADSASEAERPPAPNLYREQDRHGRY